MIPKIKTLAAFKDFLSAHGILWQSWGTGPTKPVERLFYEYQSGESMFVVEEETLVRIVQRVQILIHYKTKTGKLLFLVEDRQVFANGSSRKRSRKRSLSEKMLPHELPKSAALRALKEEIGITGVSARTLQYAGEHRDKVKSSDSYPGLLSMHTGPRFLWHMPRKWYVAEGYDEVQPDKTTEFRWRAVRKRKKRKALVK